MNTRNKLLALSMTTAMTLIACQPQTDEDRAATTSTPADRTPAGELPTSATTPPAPETSTMAEATVAAPGETLALVRAIDEHEIAAAKQAKGKKVQKSVLDYADMLEREHSKNLEAGQALAKDGITAETTAAVTSMRSKGEAELATLDAKSGKDYEKAYVDAMVMGHTEALSLIDGKLASADATPVLKRYLTDAREHVAAHLQKGKDLQASLQ